MTRMPKSPLGSGRGIEIFNQFESDPFDRHEHHLGDPISWLDDDIMRAPIPGRYQHLPLIIRIDETH